MVNYKTMKFLSGNTHQGFFSAASRSGCERHRVVGEFRGGKMLRFDPKTQDMKEFPLPGPQPTPYGLGIDAKGNIWYASYNMDELGCFDPKTGKTVEYRSAFREYDRELIRMPRAHVVRHPF